VGVEALLRSLETFERERWDEKLDRTLGEALRVDENRLAYLRVDQVDVTKGPQWVQQLVEVWPRLVERLLQIPSNIADPSSTAEFKSLLETAEFKQLCASGEFRERLPAVREAMELRGIADRRVDSLISALEQRSRR
jgi:hypothetical protein